MPAWKDENRKHKVRSDAKWDSRTAGIVSRLLACGFTYEDAGYAIGVKGHTIQDWQQRYPIFKKQIEKAREAIKSITIAQALRCAWGYEYEEIDDTYETLKGMAISLKDGVAVYESNKPVLKKTVVHKKYQPPNPDLLKFVLLNRDKENWTDVKRIDVSSKSTNLNLIGEAETEAIDALVGRLVKKIESKEIVNAKPDETGGEQPAVVLVGDTNGVVPEYSI